jgi:hypothetical protein
MSDTAQKNNFLLALGGLSGSGKTTAAHAVAKKLKDTRGIEAVVLESDPIRKDILGVPHTTRLGKDGYTWEVTKQVIAEMNRRTEELLAEGKSVIWTSTLVAENQRKEKEDYAQQAGVVFAGFWLDTHEDVLIDRVTKRAEAGTDASDATAEIVKMQIAQQKTVTDWPKIDAGRSIDTVAQDIISEMEKRKLIAPQAAPEQCNFRIPQKRRYGPRA